MARLVPPLAVLLIVIMWSASTSVAETTSPEVSPDTNATDDTAGEATVRTGPQQHLTRILISWQVAILFLGFVVITVVWEFSIALLTFFTKKYSGRKALWVQRLKDEILALGVITLVLVGAEEALAGQCIPGQETEYGTEEKPEHECPEGQHLLFTSHRITETHLLLFTVAVVLIVYTCTSLYLSIWRMGYWSKWEEQVKDGSAPHVDPRAVFHRLCSNSVTHGARMFLWNGFYSWMYQDVYTMLRFLFLQRMDNVKKMTDRLPRQFNFLNITLQAMEVSFSKAAEHAWVLSFVVAVFLVIPIDTHALYWLAAICTLVMLACSAKLQSILTHLAVISYCDFYEELKEWQNQYSTGDTPDAVSEEMPSAFEKQSSNCDRLDPSATAPAAGVALGSPGGAPAPSRRSAELTPSPAGDGDGGRAPASSPLSSADVTLQMPIESLSGAPPQKSGRKGKLAQADGMQRVTSTSPLLELSASACLPPLAGLSTIHSGIGNKAAAGSAPGDHGYGHAAVVVECRDAGVLSADGTRLYGTGGSDGLSGQVVSVEMVNPAWEDGGETLSPSGRRPKGEKVVPVWWRRILNLGAHKPWTQMKLAPHHAPRFPGFVAPPGAASHMPRAKWTVKDPDTGEVVNDMNALFWLQSPQLLLWIIQLCYMENSLSLTILLYGVIRDYNGIQEEASLPALWTLITVDLLLMVFAAMTLLPLYALCTVAGTPECRRLMAEVKGAKAMDEDEDYENGIGGLLLRVLHISDPPRDEEEDGFESDYDEDGGDLAERVHKGGEGDHAFILALADQAGVILAHHNHQSRAKDPIEAIYGLFMAMWREKALAWRRAGGHSGGGGGVDGRNSVESAALLVPDFRRLTLRVEMKRLQKTFLWLARSSNGDATDTITAEELALEMRELGTRCTHAEQQDMLKAVDSDNGQDIDFSEMVLFMVFKFLDRGMDGFVGTQDVEVALVKLLPDSQLTNPRLSPMELRFTVESMVYYVQHCNGEENSNKIVLNLKQFLAVFKLITFINDPTSPGVAVWREPTKAPVRIVTHGSTLKRLFSHKQAAAVATGNDEA